jgi:putative selenate reductase
MSIQMKQISFPRLMEQAMREYRTKETMFGVPVTSILVFRNYAPLFGTTLNTAVGPAAGPHTQLAQNLVAGYVAGGRFFELKTVQVLWGEQLGIQRPCIYVRDEGYNTEWSTELSPEQAAEEYIKGWLAIKLLCKEFHIGDPNAFLFNMSVGYDLPGIQSPSVDHFIETMKDASSSPFWKQCILQAKELPFEVVDEAYIDSISPHICNNVTISTMHGCPPEQIKAIAKYMMEEKHLHTYIKCNPTLIGYEKARALLDELGYTDIQFDRSQFDHDMKLEDAVEMCEELLDLGEELELHFGVKLTNTFPVKIQHNELPGDTMYLSGKALFPLSMHTAALLSGAMGGLLPISYSGGADEKCIAQLYAAGIYPITVATALLKAGGYKNLKKMVEHCANIKPDFYGVDTSRIRYVAERCMESPHFRRKEPKKILGKLPPFACGQCHNCVDVCPNRANYFVDGLEKTVIHLDGPCNDCGNCASLCPFGFKPYADKFVLYPDRNTLEESTRDGFAITEDGYVVRYQGEMVSDPAALPQEVTQLMDAVKEMNLAQ